MAEPAKISLASTGRPHRDATFSSKSERKRVRKSMIRAHVRNRVVEASVAARSRAEFYRNLRVMKLRRRQIATEMERIAVAVTALLREVHRVEDRHPDATISYIEDATMLIKAANGSIGAAADEWHAFSRQRIWFTEAVPA